MKKPRPKIGHRWVDESTTLDCPRCGMKLMQRFSIEIIPYAPDSRLKYQKAARGRKLFCRFCPFKINL